jgi:hypothetical protein
MLLSLSNTIKSAQNDAIKGVTELIIINHEVIDDKNATLQVHTLANLEIIVLRATL